MATRRTFDSIAWMADAPVQVAGQFDAFGGKSNIYRLANGKYWLPQEYQAANEWSSATLSPEAARTLGGTPYAVRATAKQRPQTFLPDYSVHHIAPEYAGYTFDAKPDMSQLSQLSQFNPGAGGNNSIWGEGNVGDVAWKIGGAMLGGSALAPAGGGGAVGAGGAGAAAGGGGLATGGGLGVRAGAGSGFGWGAGGAGASGGLAGGTGAATAASGTAAAAGGKGMFDMGAAGLMAGGQALSGLLGYSAAEEAADAQLAGVNAGIGEQRRQYEQNRQDLAPYRTAGYSALDKLQSLIEGYKPFDGTELANDPGYQFALNEGKNAIEQSAAARGGLFSGKTLKDLARYATDYAGTQFNQRGAFRLGEQAQRYNQLAGLSGTGQAAAMGGAQLGANSAATIADLYGSGGAARAAGMIGGANALGNAFSNAGNMYYQQSMLDRLFPQAAAGGGGGYSSGARANMDAYDLMSGV